MVVGSSSGCWLRFFRFVKSGIFADSNLFNAIPEMFIHRLIPQQIANMLDFVRFLRLFLYFTSNYFPFGLCIWFCSQSKIDYKLTKQQNDTNWISLLRSLVKWIQLSRKWLQSCMYEVGSRCMQLRLRVISKEKMFVLAFKSNAQTLKNPVRFNFIHKAQKDWMSFTHESEKNTYCYYSRCRRFTAIPFITIICIICRLQVKNKIVVDCSFHVQFPI